MQDLLVCKGAITQHLLDLLAMKRNNKTATICCLESPWISGSAVVGPPHGQSFGHSQVSGNRSWVLRPCQRIACHLHFKNQPQIPNTTNQSTSLTVGMDPQLNLLPSQSFCPAASTGKSSKLALRPEICAGGRSALTWLPQPNMRGHVLFFGGRGRNNKQQAIPIPFLASFLRNQSWIISSHWSAVFELAGSKLGNCAF